MARYEQWSPPPPIEKISEQEELFSELLDRAIRSPETMRSFFDTERPTIVDEIEPYRTLRELEIASRCDFLSGVLLLGSSVLSWGVERHVLGVLEALAHIAYVMGEVPDTPLADAEARATCVALGRAIEQRDIWRDGRARPDALEVREQAVRRAAEAHAATGCDCAGRGVASVQQTLEALTDGADGSLAVLPEVWMVLRASAAGEGAQRLVPAPTGDDLAYAPFTHRGLMLATLLNSYAMAAGWLLSMDHQDHAEMLVHVTDALLESPDMKEAMSGEFDAKNVPDRARSQEF